MSVKKRKTSKGETAEYHYDFTENNKRYRGVCEGCTTERAALAYEKEKRELVKKLVAQKNAVALVENFRQELTGSSAVSLKDAYQLYEKKPRPKQAGSSRAKQNRRIWDDFCAFMENRYPGIVNLAEVTKSHAEEYLAELRNNGRFIKEKNFLLPGRQKTISYVSRDCLSPTTLNQYLKQCKSVFTWLKEDAGLLNNPFDLPLQKAMPESREAFTPEELRLIGNHLNNFVRPIFIIGICTGLSEGDICLLKWSEIHDGWITRKRRKTGALLDIPILPPLADFLTEQHTHSGTEEYVLPDHAKMYLTNHSGISYRFKSFLEELGIQTTRNVEGRSRAISIRDVHSLRHTFAYMAGVYQIPLPVVQSILGHMSAEMTRHYQAHADRKAKEKYLAQLPDFLESTAKQIPRLGSSPREQLQQVLARLSEKAIEKVLAYAQALQ